LNEKWKKSNFDIASVFLFYNTLAKNLSRQAAIRMVNRNRNFWIATSLRG